MAEWHRNTDARPSPEALLQAARREESLAGKLKIFVGAAPGVGKTYEMLLQARARRRDGVDVVVGVVETHGRKETETLLEGLEVIPRRQLDYRGQQLEEMDLDAVVARRPKIAVVDELAHTNAAGSRHPKRYLDVEELLDRGIDVYTTVNIQHIESLNDVVAQITHVRVRETVPDRMFDRAEAVELVDITPDDLIQRLKDGKVYVPRQAERALEHFFSSANLTALRELALRRTAERVDEQLLDQLQARALHGAWAAGERILVCINEDPVAQGLVRYAKRLADRLHAQFTALSVETSRNLQFSEEQRDRLADTLRLAQTLGAEAVSIPSGGRRIADDLIAYARANNITQIVVGKSSRSRLFEIVYGSVVHDLVRRADDISVHVIAGEDALEEPPARADDQAGGPPEPPRPAALRRRPARRRRGARLRRGDLAVVRHRECRPRLPDGDRRHRRQLRPVAVAVGDGSRVARLQLLLHGAALHLHDRRSAQHRGLHLLHGDRGVRLQRRGAGPHPGGGGLDAGAQYRIPLFLQPQARRRRHPRRRAVGDRLPDRPDAAGAGRAAAGGGRLDRGQGRLSAGGHPRRGRSRRGEMGLAERPCRRPQLRHAARRQAPVPADAHRARRHRRRRHRQRPAGRDPHARRAAAARRPDRPGGARHRARPPRRGHRPGQARHRGRSPAQRPSDLDLARPQDSPVRGAGLGRRTARPRRASSARPSAPSCSAPSSTKPSGSTASSPICST
jgi:nucleotide-binding universal stress UspA family protein